MQDLAGRLARGESAAFAVLYDGCADQLHHYLVLRLGSRDAADEVLQETFLRLARSYRRFASVENPMAYVFTVARNEASRKNQRHARERGVLSAADLFDIADDDDRESREAAQDVAESLQALRDDEREVIELKFYSGLTFREIAEVLAIPQGTAATRYRAALDKLRSFLAKERS